MRKDILYSLGLGLAAVLILWGGRKVAMKIKQGALIADLTDQMKTGLNIAAGIFEDHGVEAVVTSGTDSKHGVDTYHTEGNAVDLRLASRLDPDLDDTEIRAELADALGQDFDVVLEKDHFHIEYDRRRVAARKKSYLAG